ncbi:MULTISPECIES: ABC transporter permease [unclassified Sporolactobacillus]|uniref:ABC transporter permease n=1 Tax=unclassified Sporolactobacillus TaxID=2628533 RepID=UPI002367C95F|nr:ABC transporter permease [Sporolactobacillus sp. CQH2019]MDD9150811.1 ABC transporter permease [Sporolactobacillus sp. CQH2019]
MNLVRGAFLYIVHNREAFNEALRTHLELSGSALLIGLLISIPLGIICARHARLSGLITGTVNSLRVIPSLAVLIIVMPILGTGFTPALVALTILSCPPIIINTHLGIRSVPHEVIESAVGMGMNNRQILFRIEVPVALPMILSGVRTASVEVISSATLAAFIGGGGLGTFIIDGLGLYNFAMLLVGAVPVALLAICSEVAFGTIEKLATKYRQA